MPTISEFFGILIRMYFDDHFPAHFHVEYQGKKAQISIEEGKLIKGNLSPRALKLVEEWRQIHVAELKKNWERAKNLQLPEKIEPLD